MQRLLPLTIFLFITSFSCGQNEYPPITIGERDSLYSDILGEDRWIWVHVPQDNRGNTYAPKSYPVVYLLDGSAHFHSVVGMLRQLSFINSICPRMIVVGIMNTNRERDLTPTKGKIGQRNVDNYFAENSGGGPQFTAFLEKELIPFVDANYPTAPYRTFIGHSLGGLTVMNTFTHHPALFDAYIAIDPSMIWDDQTLLNQIKNQPIDERYKGKSLYLAIANTMDGLDLSLEQARKDNTENTEYIRSNLELHDYLKANAKDALKYEGKFYGEDDHGSVPLIAEYDAFRFIFDYHRFFLTFKDYRDPEQDTYGKIKSVYETIAQELGYDKKPEEDYINGLAYYYLGQEQFKKAEQFFKMNVANYPNSFNVYDSIGDYYNAVGDTKNALLNFEKAYALNPQSYTKEKIDALKTKGQ